MKEDMKRLLKITKTSLMILILFPYLVVAQPQLVQLEDAVKLTNKCIELLKNKNLEQVAHLFHFPPEYNEQEVIDDISGIQDGVRELTQEFGPLINAKLLNEPAQYINLKVGSGNISYWKKHPEFISVVYQVSFQKEKNGFVIFWVTNISKKIELRTIAYGLPANDPLAVERIKKIGKKMMKSFMNKHKKVDKIKI